MPIQTACPNCAKGYNLADAMKGKNVTCRNCAKVFLVNAVAAKTPVPAPKAAKPTATTTVPTPARAPTKKTAPKPPADDDIVDVLPADDDDDDPDDRPARKGSRRSADVDQPKKKSGAMMWLLLAGGGGFGFLLLIGCMGGLWYSLGGGMGKTIDQAAFDKLKTGMTESEIQAVLGKPTRELDPKNPFGVGFNPVAPGAANTPNVKYLHWEQGQNGITVTFENGKSTTIAGTFQEGMATINRVGTKNDMVAQAPPPPQPSQKQSPNPEPPNTQEGFPSPPNNPPFNPPPPKNPPVHNPQPPNNPQPKQPPTKNPPPAPPATGGGPSKMTEAGVALLSVATNKENLTFFSKDDPPTDKTVADVVAPNRKASTEQWTWTNGKGYLKIYFDKKGNIIDTVHKDLPKR